MVSSQFDVPLADEQLNMASFFLSDLLLDLHDSAGGQVDLLRSANQYRVP